MYRFINSSHPNDTLQVRWTQPLATHTEITLYSILLVWSLLGNLLVIAVVFCNQNLRTNLNYVIVNMAVSDLLIPLLAIPWYISDTVLHSYEWLGEGPLGDALCKLVYVLPNMSPYVSSLSLVIIAFQRFLAVVYPTRRQILNRKKRWILISFTWIAPMTIFSPFFYMYRMTNKWGYAKCTLPLPPAFDYITYFMVLVAITVLLGFVIPLISIIVFYTIIHYKLNKNIKSVRELIEKETIRSRQQTNRRILYMSVSVIVNFIISWCPINVLRSFINFHKPYIKSLDNDTFLSIVFAILYVHYLQTAINPCMYFVFLRDFRQGLKRLCHKKTSLTTQSLQHSALIPLQSRISNNTRHTIISVSDSSQHKKGTPREMHTTSVQNEQH